MAEQYDYESPGEDQWADEPSYADEYQELDEDIPSAGNGSWDEPSYDDGLAEGHQTAQYAEQAGFAHALIQGGEDLRQQREWQEIQDQGAQDIAAAEGYLGRPLSAGELAALQADAYDPGGHHDVTNALNEHWAKPKEQKMLETLQAQRYNALPDRQEALPGPNDDNYGLGDNPDRQALRDARDAYCYQRQQLANGEYGFIDD